MTSEEELDPEEAGLPSANAAPSTTLGDFIGKLKKASSQCLTLPEWPNLKIGTKAGFTIGFVYFTVLSFFMFIFLVTVPRSEIQLYNVTFSSEDYHGMLIMEVEPYMKPVLVKLQCKNKNKNGTVRVLYDMEEKLVAYKDPSKQLCYIRSSAGPQHQDEYEKFRELVMEKGPAKHASKQTVHMLVMPKPVSTEKLYYFVSQRILDFCSNWKKYWIVGWNIQQGPSQNDSQHTPNSLKQQISWTSHLDTCFQHVILHYYEF